MELYRVKLVFGCIIFCIFYFQGCQEQTAQQGALNPEWFNQPVWQQVRSSSYQPEPQKQQEEVVHEELTPKITFDRTAYDFGKIGVGSTNNICAFVFTNTGKANLVISKVDSSCSCTVALLESDKKEYAPGESGKLFAGYSDTQSGQVIKHIYVSSNDPENPQVEISIKAELVAPVDYEPKNLSLSLRDENAGCPRITVTSLDGRPFSIKGFRSSGNSITVKYDPKEVATKFVLEPQVDMTKLSSIPNGNFEISLSHPDCGVISGTYYTPPRFSASPQMISISEAQPRQSIIKKINIVSNYDEPFSIKTSTSGRSIVDILETEKTRSGYQLTVRINIPLLDEKNNMFSDNIRITLSGITTIDIPCNGYFKGVKVAKTQPEEECVTCGPKKVHVNDDGTYVLYK
jgi:hypothetical protein